MPLSGDGKKSILILGEGPGKQESEKNTQWVGKAGQFLRSALSNCDIDLDKDCWKFNAISCRATKGEENRKPTKKEIAFCRNRVLEVIEKYKPKYIMLFGGVAIESVLGYLFNKLGISKLHGYIIPVPKYNSWVLPIYHPSYVMRNEKDLNLQSTFKRDIKQATNFIDQDEPIPQYDYITNLKDVHLLMDIKEIQKAFKQILKTKAATAFDYECTGIKPFIQGHKIITMAISGDFGTFAFPVDYQKYWNDKYFTIVSDLIIEYLSNDNIYKVSHNARFEKMWSSEILGVHPKVDWCTMDTQHIIDHRRGITSLKFQAFVRWGIREYDRLAKMYIRSDKNESFNKMDEMPLGDQLLYVALDAKLTRFLYFEQKKQVSGKLEIARRLFLDTSDVFLNMGLNGLAVNEQHYKDSDSDLTKKIDKITKELKTSSEIVEYKKKHGKEFSETSTKDLQELLFVQMGIISTKVTTGGAKSVDAEVLGEINHPITRNILLKRKYLKIRDTYLAQFLRECTNGFINPNFSLNLARSMRSSCGQPSLQNIPKRQEEAKEIVRKGIIPSPGCFLLEADFSGAEVITAASYNKDPEFINYLISDADMHHDLTLQLWNISKSQITKELRFYTKNCWTFPQFYGDFFGSCAAALWKNCVDGKLKLKDGTPLTDHLKKERLHTLKRFTEHTKDVEDDMWYKRFKVYTNWKETINEFYQKNGYIETYFGFKFTDYLDKKQVANYPIQSTSAHLLFWSLIQVTKKIKEQNLNSVIIGQIHDSMILDIFKEEKSQIIKIIKKVCEIDLNKEFDWLLVPMKVEMEISKTKEDGGNFAEMEELKWES